LEDIDHQIHIYIYLKELQCVVYRRTGLMRISDMQAGEEKHKGGRL